MLSRGTSLVVQWLRICLLMQGTQVRPLMGKLRSHLTQGSLCAATSKPALQRLGQPVRYNERSCVLQLRPNTAESKINVKKQTKTDHRIRTILSRLSIVLHLFLHSNPVTWEDSYVRLILVRVKGCKPRWSFNYRLITVMVVAERTVLLAGNSRNKNKRRSLRKEQAQKTFWQRDLRLAFFSLIN